MKVSFLAATPKPLEERIGSLKVAQKGSFGIKEETMKPCSEKVIHDVWDYWYQRGAGDDAKLPMLCANDSEMFIAGDPIFNNYNY